MIKRFCDRCNQEIIDKPVSFGEAVKSAVINCLGYEEPSYIIYEICNNQRYEAKLELCQNCKEDLIDWIHKGKKEAADNDSK